MMMSLSSVFSFAHVEAHARNRGVSQGNKSLAPSAPFQDSEATRRRKLREQVARCWDLLQMEEERKQTDCRN